MHPDPRASLHRGQHRSENEARKDYDFRFHGIAVIEYIYAQDDPSCNTDCCRVCGNLGFGMGSPSVKPTHPFNSDLKPSSSDQTARRSDSDPRRASGWADCRFGRLAFESDRGPSFLRKSMVYNGQIHSAEAVILAYREVSLERTPPQVDWRPCCVAPRNGKVRMVHCPARLCAAPGERNYSH